MTPAEFVAMQGIAPRVFRVHKPAPEVFAVCAPEIAAFIDPAGKLQDVGLVTVVPAAKVAIPGQCSCKACKKAKLNPDPADYLISKMVRLRAAGKSPGNPKWYKVPTLPRFEFKPGLPPQFPAWTYR